MSKARTHKNTMRTWWTHGGIHGRMHGKIMVYQSRRLNGDVATLVLRSSCVGLMTNRLRGADVVPFSLSVVVVVLAVVVVTASVSSCDGVVAASASTDASSQTPGFSLEVCAMWAMAAPISPPSSFENNLFARVYLLR